MSTSTAAITAATSANIAAAAAARRNAERAACEQMVTNFQPQQADMAAKRQYARCVQVLYPEPVGPISPAAEMWLKALVVIAIFGFLLPWFRAGRAAGFGESLFLGIVFAITFPAVAAFIVLLVAGARWVIVG